MLFPVLRFTAAKQYTNCGDPAWRKTEKRSLLENFSGKTDS